MKIHILTIFPELFECVEKEGIIKIANERGLLDLYLHNLRDYTKDKHRTTDDTPYGGGAGMVMLAGPVLKGIADIEKKFGPSYKVMLAPQGERFTQETANFLKDKESLLFIPAHYEGIDERVIELADMELSTGDYVVSGGELPTMLVVDAVVRLIPGVLGNRSSLSEESFENNLLEYPQYSRPREISGKEVPDVLISGHHENIKKWRLKQSLKRTLIKRPDLILKKRFTKEEKELLEEIKNELEKVLREILNR